MPVLSAAIHPAYIVVLATGGYAIIWCLVVKVISLFGWGKLARHHRSFREATGTRLSWQSLLLGKLMRYNRCVTIYVETRGIHLQMLPFFRIGHPNLFLEWAEVRYLQEEKGLLGTHYLYALGSSPVVRARFHLETHRAIQNRPEA